MKSFGCDLPNPMTKYKSWSIVMISSAPGSPPQKKTEFTAPEKDFTQRPQTTLINVLCHMSSNEDVIPAQH